MSKKLEMIKSFLEGIQNNKNKVLIESIKKGADICFEGVSLGYQPMTASIPMSTPFLNKSEGHGEDYPNVIEGGVGDDLHVDDVDQEELKLGIEIEKEHSDDESVAVDIAMDHLKEIPDYYSRLKKMEKEAKAEWAEKRNK